MSKMLPNEIRAQGFIARLCKRIKGITRDDIRHNLFFTDYRVRKGKRVGASKKQRLRHAIVYGKF